jgi:hypothetical protein
MEHEQLYCNALPGDTKHDPDTVAILLVTPTWLNEGLKHTGYNIRTIARASHYARNLWQWIYSISDELRGWYPLPAKDLPLYLHLKIKDPVFDQIISGQYKGDLQ